MKKGDIVETHNEEEQGAYLFSNAESKEQVEAFMKNAYKKYFPYTTIPHYEVVISDEVNKGKWCAKALHSFTRIDRFKVLWVDDIDNTASLQSILIPGAYTEVSTTDSTLIVIQEAAPSFQSQVCKLSDEELMAQIESLRAGRSAIAPEAKARKPKASKEDSEMEKILASLSIEARAELEKKLGL